MTRPTTDEIFKTLREKHNIDLNGNDSDIRGMLNYARTLGYNEGWVDGIRVTERMILKKIDEKFDEFKVS